MATIRKMTELEERAYAYVFKKFDPDLVCHADFVEDMVEEYKEIATEQKAIDNKRYEEYLAYMNRELTNDLSFQRKTIIDKACEWITNHNGDDSVIEEFRKYMEE